MHTRQAASRLPALLPTPNMSSSRLYQNIPPSLSMRHDPHHQQQFHSSQFPNSSMVATTPTNNNSSPFSNQVGEINFLSMYFDLLETNYY